MSEHSDLQTNRSLYVSVAELCEKHAECTRNLEDYLKALWVAGTERRELDGLSPSTFIQLMGKASLGILRLLIRLGSSMFGRASPNSLATAAGST
jgi:hypothetical protein